MRKLLFHFSRHHRHTGLFILRIGIGIMFMIHGWPKISGGPEKWNMIGGAMTHTGLGFAPHFWGFMASFAEFFGGLLLMLGLLFRPAALLLFATMLVATLKHISADDGFGGYSHAAESAILFFSLLFIGPGKYSFDEKWRIKTNKHDAL